MKPLTTTDIKPRPINPEAACDPNPNDEHFNYDELDACCPCALCGAYRQAKIDLESAMVDAGGLSWKGMCPRAKHRRRAHIHMLAVSNMRDLYCEMSYLTHTKRDGAEMMTWLLGKLRSRKESWWANHSAKKTLGAWIVEWAVEKGLMAAGA